MAISFVNESHSPGMSSYVTSVTINVPTGVQADDLLFALVGGTRSSAPSGWTLIGSAAQGSSTGTVYLYYRIATGSEPASYTFNFDTFRYSKNHSIIAYRGVNTTTPIGNSDVQAVADNDYGTNSIVVTANQWIVSFATHYTFSANNSIKTWTINTGQERADYGGEVGTEEDSSTCWFDSNGGLSAASYSRTHTVSASTSVGTTGIVALNPAGTTHNQNPSDTVTLSESVEVEKDGPIVFTSAYSVDVGYTP